MAHPHDPTLHLRAGRVLFIWDGHPVTAPITGRNLDYHGQLIVDAKHPVTGVAEFKRVWAGDCVPAPTSAGCPVCGAHPAPAPPGTDPG